MQVSLSKRGAVAALGVAAVLALSACGGDGTTTEPSSSGATSSAPQASESPSSPKPQKATPDHPAQNLVPPELPDEAKEFTEEGLAAFIEYWVEERNYAFATGDDSRLRAISHEECRFCNNELDAVANIANGGGKVWLVGGNMQVEPVRTKIYTENENLQNAQITLRQLSGEYYDESGLIEELRGVVKDWVEPYEFAAVYRNGAWLAVRIEVQR